MRIALLIGVALGILPLVTAPPAGLGVEAWRVLGIGFLMAVLWVAEPLPLAATALIPLAAFPLAGVAPMADLAPAYAHPLIILFLGGFLLGRAVEKWDLHRRLALSILQASHGRPARMIGGMMAATAFLSLWISNTATAMIMAPIGVAVASGRPKDEAFAAAALLGVAYAATIGGMGSLIGTPPNALFAAYMEEAHGVTIGFAEWAVLGVPTLLVLLPVTWFLLTKVMFRISDTPIAEAWPESAPMTTGARRVLWIATFTALAWVLRPVLDRWSPTADLTDAGIAMIAALALFICPDGAGGRLLEWKTARSLRWDVLILFGGGLALASAIDVTGLAAWLAAAAASLEGLPTIFLIGAFAAIIVLVGELASNTAMAAIFLPVAGATALGFGVDPLLFTLPVALAASVGFMLPVATPPNAIVFAHAAVTRERMLRAGAPLDLIGVVIAVGIAYLLAPLVFGG